MWMEVKVLISGIGTIFIAIGLSQVILTQTFIGIIMILGMGVYFFGDFLIGWVITQTHAKYMMDKPPPGWETAVVLDINGSFDMAWAKKREYGKREFKHNGKNADCINEGKYSIHLPNGSIGFICHEKSEKTIDPMEVEYASKLRKRFHTNNIKEMYAIAKKKEHEVRIVE